MARMPLLVFVSACFGNKVESPCEIEIGVDQIEINTIYDSQCRPVFVQAIVWRKMAIDNGRMHNIGWCAVHTKLDLPIRRGALWWLTVYDHDRVIYVRAPFLKRSWTQDDPERTDSKDWWKGNPPNIFQRQNEVP